MIAENKINWEVLSLTRFMLAFIVLAGHLEAYTSIGILKFYQYLGSFEAILGFLLISGLSIGKSISRNKDSYLERRIKRIYPVYFASLVCAFFFLPHDNNLTFFVVLLVNLLFLNQIIVGSSFVGPSWTLALEVWLYAAAPILFRLSFKVLLFITYVSFISYCCYTCGRTLYHWNYYSGTKYGINLILLSFIWISGFTLAIFPNKKFIISANIAFMLIGHISLTILIQALFRYKHHQMDLILLNDLPGYVGKVICLILVYFIVLFNQRLPVVTGTFKVVFNFLGNISYPLYLLHSPLFKYLSTHHVSNCIIMITSALFLSCVVYWIFDFYSKKRIAINSD